MSNKQTAVEWLEERFYFAQGQLMDINFEQAKEMEKQQMFEYIKNNYCIGHKSLEFHRLEFEQYYNETFKNK